MYIFIVQSSAFQLLSACLSKAARKPRGSNEKASAHFPWVKVIGSVTDFAGH